MLHRLKMLLVQAGRFHAITAAAHATLRPCATFPTAIHCRLGSSDADEMEAEVGEASEDGGVAQLWAGPEPARAAAVLDTDAGARRVVLAAGRGLLIQGGGGAGAGFTAAARDSAAGLPGGMAVQALDFALDPASGARILVASGWAGARGPQLLLSGGVMAGAPLAGCDFEARAVPGGAGAGAGACLVRAAPSEPQRLYALVMPQQHAHTQQLQQPAPLAPLALAPAGPEAAAAAGGGGCDSLWLSPDLGASWRQVRIGCARAAGLRLHGLALCGCPTRPGRLLVTGSADAPAPAAGQAPAALGGSTGAERAAVVLYSRDGGATFADLSAAVARAAEPAARAARERHAHLQALHPGHAAHCRHAAAAAGGAGPLPLFVHTAAVVALPDGQVLFCDPEAAPDAAWHAACQLPGPVWALSSSDGLSSPSAALPRA